MHAHGRCATRILALVLFLSCVPAPAVRAQAAIGPATVDPTAVVTPSTDPASPMEPPSGHSSKAGIAPLVAPVPFKTSQLGWGLALMLGAIHRFDADTTVKPSTGVVGGWYSENKSWGWAIGEMARLKQDTWRLRGLYTYADINYDFYGIGQDAGDANQSIGLEQTLDVGLLGIARRVKGPLYGGVTGLWMKTKVEVQDQPEPLLPPEIAAWLKERLAGRIEDLKTTTLFAAGAMGEYDTRNDDYWPNRGTEAKLSALFFNGGLGGEMDFQRYILTWSWYKQLHGERVILATNLNGSANAGDSPFFMLPSIGMGQYGLRGYTAGRYRDKVMTTVQAELRLHAPGRFGATFFGGFGQVAEDAAGLFDAKVLPAGGLGVRYQLIKSYLMHLRADYAWGLDERQIYFGVSEAF